MTQRVPIDGVTYPSTEDAERYCRERAWHSRTLGDTLRDTARRLPGKTALVSRERRLTYAELDAATETLAANLYDLGLRPGERAIFQMGSVVETAIALLACAKAGIVPVCALPQHREIEISALVERSRPRAYFVQADFGSFDLVGFARKMVGRYAIAHMIAARANRHSDSSILHFEDLVKTGSQTSAKAPADVIGIGDVLMLQLSGGTTNVPKLIPRLHGEHLGQGRDWAQRTAMGADTVALYAMPLMHNAGLVAMFYPCILLGGTFVLMPRMEPKSFFDLVERERVTHSLSIGPAAGKMLEYAGIRDHDLSSVQLLTNFHGSQAMERHVGVPCLNIYGITEGFIMSSRQTSSERVRYETVGWPVSTLDEIRILEPGTERDVRPGETGELCFRGPSSIRGYFSAPEINRASFTSNGFLRTGDLLVAESIDGEMCHSFRGRIKDNIDRGGEKFGAEEVEILIGRHPDILDAKIVAMPDRLYGEKACAFLILRPGTQSPTVAQLGQFLLDQGLAKFKLPERIEVIASMPVTRVGKVDKQALRDLVAGKITDQIGEGKLTTML